MSETEEHMLKPGEVAALFAVNTATLSRWARAGKIPSITIPNGHRRYRESEVRALLARGEDE